MKKIQFLIALVAMQLSVFGIDTLKVQSKITDVTVFFSGAQVTRMIDLDATKGKHLLIADQLPMELNPQSLQVDGIDFCKILSVKHQVIFPADAKKGKEEAALQDEIELQEQKILEIKNRYAVYDLEENLLMGNSKFGTKDEGTTVAEIREAADFYRLRLNEIRQGKLNLSRETDQINKKIQELYGRLNELTAAKTKPYSQVIISVECEKVVKGSFRIRYYVPSAGWAPYYDFRVDEITKPLSIVYNANVYQSTGESWNQVNLTLSSHNPSLSGDKPELSPWYLGRSIPVQQLTNPNGIGSLKGRVLDEETGEAIPFANVIVERNNQLITGTVSDMDGQFMIKPLAVGTYNVKVTYIGYQTVLVTGVSVRADQITFLQDFKLKANNLQLQEVVINNYAAPLMDKSNMTITSQEIMKMPAASGVYAYSAVPDGLDLSSGDFWARSSQAKSHSKAEDKEEGVVISNYISNSLKTNITNMEYRIDIPYTIPSNGEDYSIRIKEVSVPVRYVYHCIPKIDPAVFLSAEIVDWNQLNLLSGKTNIYFQGTFTSQSYIDAEKASDTLTISLGRDHNVLVTRDGSKELMDKKIIGSNIRETIGWDISLKNNRNTVINIIVEDQFPVSEKKSIEVEKIDYSGAVLDEKTGKLTWTLVLEPGAKRVISYKYAVKYPRLVNLMLE
ncbi:MAG TPA: mucoidy inhibitor MuiA family protein [Bacteroidales bacterium]|nr:mucoidy inhibitor MuiA family protein [Bacteroidales bacterium]HRZ47838.1 mucoidy inhibitor MuiA family protein [Bacteroidales bacterium]